MSEICDGNGKASSTECEEILEGQGKVDDTNKNLHDIEHLSEHIRNKINIAGSGLSGQMLVDEVFKGFLAKKMEVIESEHVKKHAKKEKKDKERSKSHKHKHKKKHKSKSSHKESSLGESSFDDTSQKSHRRHRSKSKHALNDEVDQQQTPMPLNAENYDRMETASGPRVQEMEGKEVCSGNETETLTKELETSGEKQETFQLASSGDSIPEESSDLKHVTDNSSMDCHNIEEVTPPGSHVTDTPLKQSSDSAVSGLREIKSDKSSEWKTSNDPEKNCDSEGYKKINSVVKNLKEDIESKMSGIVQKRSKLSVDQEHSKTWYPDGDDEPEEGELLREKQCHGSAVEADCVIIAECISARDDSDKSKSRISDPVITSDDYIGRRNDRASKPKDWKETLSHRDKRLDKHSSLQAIDRKEPADYRDDSLGNYGNSRPEDGSTRTKTNVQSYESNMDKPSHDRKKDSSRFKGHSSRSKKHSPEKDMDSKEMKLTSERRSREERSADHGRQSKDHGHVRRSRSKSTERARISRKRSQEKISSIGDSEFKSRRHKLKKRKHKRSHDRSLEVIDDEEDESPDASDKLTESLLKRLNTSIKKGQELKSVGHTLFESQGTSNIGVESKPDTGQGEVSEGIAQLKDEIPILGASGDSGSVSCTTVPYDNQVSSQVVGCEMDKGVTSISLNVKPGLAKVKKPVMKMGIRLTETSVAIISSGVKVETEQKDVASGQGTPTKGLPLVSSSDDSSKNDKQLEKINFDDSILKTESDILGQKEIVIISDSGKNSTLETCQHSQMRSESRERITASQNQSETESKQPKYELKKKSHRRPARERILESRSRSRDQGRSSSHSSCASQRSRSRSRFRGHRSRSRSKDRRHKLRSRSRDRHKKSRSRLKRKSRSHSRERRRRSIDRHDKSRSRSRDRRKSPERFGRFRERRSRSQSAEARKPIGDLRLKIDKARLREIAIKKVYGNLNEGVGPVANMKPDTIASLKAGGKSVEELTDFCKRIAEKEKNQSPESQAEDEKRASDDDDESLPFTANTFKARDLTSIVLNIRNSKPLPVLTSQEKIAKAAELRTQFPVSSGSLHRAKEWVPVEKAKPADGTGTPAGTSIKVEEAEEKVFPDPPKEPIDVGHIVSERLSALRKLQSNPGDAQALDSVAKSQKQMQQWAASKQLPGLFIGSTGASVMSQKDLIGPNPRNQAWVKKDAFTRARPVDSGIGKLLLERMGWKEGEGLGKNNEGMTAPLLVDIKMDRKGLTSIEENGKKGQPVVAAPPIRFDFSGKHPVSALNEICSKRRWNMPNFILMDEAGPSHSRTFRFKVEVNGVEYIPTTTSSNKKSAKFEAATVCLQELGLLLKT